MRALSLMTLAASLLLVPGCKSKPAQDKPDWLALPESYQPVDGEFTFNKAGLKQFNSMSAEERDALVENLKNQPGSFKGQAIFKSGANLGENIAESKYGSYELAASTDAILFEITIDYSIYTTPELGKGIAQHRPIEFSGTLVALEYQDSNKPRKLTIMVKADNVTALR